MMILPRTDPKYYGSDLQFSSLCEGYSEMAQSFIEKWNLNSDALDTLNSVHHHSAGLPDYEYPSADAGNAKKYFRRCV